MERFFHLKEHGTTVRTEIVAGITTFVTMAYIIFVNPSMIGGDNGPLNNGVFFATCISAFVGTILMGLLAKLPFAQAPGMGLNAFFAFTVMPAMLPLSGNENLSIYEQYQMALAIVFLSGLLFIAITLLGLREAIVRAIPKNIKLAISGGIDLFLAFLGLQNAGLVVNSDSTLVGLVDFSKISGAETKTLVMGAIVAFIGLIVIAALYKLRVKGAILIGILVSTLLSYIPFIGVASWPAEMKFNFGAQFGDFVDVSLFSFTGGFGHMFEGKNLFGAITTVLVLIIAFSMVDMFDTIGTLPAPPKSRPADEDGNMPGMKGADMRRDCNHHRRDDGPLPDYGVQRQHERQPHQPNRLHHCVWRGCEFHAVCRNLRRRCNDARADFRGRADDGSIREIDFDDISETYLPSRR
ncbi:MAG: NCS2 family permease [Oscillospiraceae bacterium]